MNSDYLNLYKEYEQLVEGYNWSLSDCRKLTYRERKHWVNRYLFRLEQEYERMHQLNNQNQTIMRSVGEGVTFSGIPYR